MGRCFKLCHDARTQCQHRLRSAVGLAGRGGIVLDADIEAVIFADGLTHFLPVFRSLNSAMPNFAWPVEPLTAWRRVQFVPEGQWERTI